MQIRPLKGDDVVLLDEIDGTIESSRYLHVDASGEGLHLGWRLEERALRTKLIEPNRLSDDQRFSAKSIATGIDDGIALLAEHEDAPVALLVAMPRHSTKTVELLDVRVEFEHRREGLATAMLFQVIQAARDLEMRAVAAQTRTNNFPAAQMLAKLGFELTGLDVQHHSTHDLVKESVTLFWHLPLD